MLRSKTIIHADASESQLLHPKPAIQLFVIQTTQSKSSTMYNYGQRAPSRRGRSRFVDPNRNLIAVSSRYSNVLLFYALCVRDLRFCEQLLTLYNIPSKLLNVTRELWETAYRFQGLEYAISTGTSTTDNVKLTFSNSGLIFAKSAASLPAMLS
jgi:hypothetical protein